MKITKEAIDFFYRMFFSCYDNNKKSSRENRSVIEFHLDKGSDMEFDTFCSDLQQWDSRKEAIEKVANTLGKKIIDKEVLINYFGGHDHTEIVVNELALDNIPKEGKFYRYTVFNHMLVPLKVQNVSSKVPVINGLYENADISLPVKHLFFLEKDREKIKIGKTILCHYPMVIDADPDPEMVNALIESHRKDSEFMRAAYSFSDGIDHIEFYHFSVLRKRIL